jgi:hypothetical protein
VIVGFDAVGGHYVSASDDVAVVTGGITIDGHRSVETFVRDVRTGTGLEVGSGATITVDAAPAATPSGANARARVGRTANGDRS